MLGVNLEIPVGRATVLRGTRVSTLCNQAIQFGNTERPEHCAVTIFEYLWASHKDLFDRLPGRAEKVHFPEDSTVTCKAKCATDIPFASNTAGSKSLGNLGCHHFSILQPERGLLLEVCLRCL